MSHSRQKCTSSAPYLAWDKLSFSLEAPDRERMRYEPFKAGWRSCSVCFSLRDCWLPRLCPFFTPLIAICSPTHYHKCITPFVCSAHPNPIPMGQLGRAVFGVGSQAECGGWAMGQLIHHLAGVGFATCAWPRAAAVQLLLLSEQQV